MTTFLRFKQNPLTKPCSFCDGPWHAATGCEYGPRIRSCHTCTVEFWKWVRQHTNKSPRRRKDQPPPMITFYEAAGKRWPK
jgi:hypothetical protein